MSGFVNAISFSAIFVWCGFQSGNTVQLAIAVARNWEGTNEGFSISDKQALASLTTFVFGSLLARSGEVLFPPKSRGWLWLGTLLQALLTMASAIASWKSGQGYPGISDDRFSVGPAWSDPVSYLTLIFMSMSMGFQGIMSIRLKTNSGATLPLTTTWVELCGAEALFRVHKLDTPRDQRMLGIASVFIGVLAGRALVFALGSSGALGVGAGIRVLIAFSWIFVPSSKDWCRGNSDREKLDMDSSSPSV
ncbi:hypothetical protein GYMLUDRAFT_40815 [Collybiopsis luxurians FD-317 M1]|uniref:Uncharacterized protein n=1 Tax=Collybiopsis luxurians FD-317 M1 TaxID=944289 RepID=A0A0D0C6H3_9AGAR|nr:hypothetical protein GYMLUDRAFT_40815 [Collybiopsis luxurians FD-317 M1]